MIIFMRRSIMLVNQLNLINKTQSGQLGVFDTFRGALRELTYSSENFTKVKPSCAGLKILCQKLFENNLLRISVCFTKLISYFLNQFMRTFRFIFKSSSNPI